MHMLKTREVGLSLALVVVWLGVARAQPNPEALATRIEAAHASQLAEVNRVTIVSTIEGGMVAGIRSTSRYVKEERDGKPVLQAVEEGDMDMMNVAGFHDGTLPDMVRHAREIRADRLDGSPVFVVTVDDADFLRSLDDLQLDEELADDDFVPKEATLWLDTNDLSPRRLQFIQTGPQGGEMTFTVLLADYQVHRGLPIAHRMDIRIQGMEQMMSAADLAEARQQMQQLTAQLEMMPEEHRAMIEAQMAPQIEQFEKMMAGGGTEMRVRVVDVQVE